MLELVAAEVPTTRDHLEHELLRIRGEIEIRELYFSRLAAALSAMNLAEDNGSEMTTIDWLRFNCRLTQNVASDRVAIGEKLAAMPLSEDALYNGEIGIHTSRPWPRRRERWARSSTKRGSYPWPRSTRRASSITSPSTTGTRSGRKRSLPSKPTWPRTAPSP